MAEALAFDGSVAVVTGAAGGLGRAHALLLAERGCRVVVNDAGTPFQGDVPAAARVVAEIVAAGGDAVADDHDVVADGEAVIATAVDAFGTVDVVVNNAGVAASPPIGPDAVDAWRRTIDVTVAGSVAVTAAAWPHLERSGSGRVVMTASNAMFGARFSGAYSTAKSAMFGLTRSLAGHGRRSGIAVNCIMPAAWTRLTGALPEGPVAELMERRCPPEDVAAFVAWLCHPGCPLSGETFSVGGGRAARVVLSEAPGVVLGDGADPGEWGDRVEELMAIDELGHPLTIDDEVSWLAAHLGGEVPEAFRPGGALAWDRRPL